MATVYSIPEQALRNLPTHVPGHRGIKISNCQCSVVTDKEPTPSTFFFDQRSLKVICQVIDVIPRHSDRPDRTLYVVVLQQGGAWFGFLKKRLFGHVLKFLKDCGAVDTQVSLTENIAKWEPSQLESPTIQP